MQHQVCRRAPPSVVAARALTMPATLGPTHPWQVWVQVETKECFESMDDVLSVPGISCAFLGAWVVGLSGQGLHDETKKKPGRPACEREARSRRVTDTHTHTHTHSHIRWQPRSARNEVQAFTQPPPNTLKQALPTWALPTAFMCYDLPGMLASPQMDRFYADVLAACRRHGVAPGVFCLGKERAAKLGGMGYRWVGFDTDLNALISHAGGVVGALR